MAALIMTLQLILSLSLLVFIHELGHFLAAKAFGMRVEKFYIFFDWGGKIWSKQIGETEYGIGLIPLGGYVKIAGMIDESMDKEQMAQEPQEWEFRSKPAWQRFIVMIGGIVMNILLGLIIFAGYNMYFDKDYIPVSELNKEGVYAMPMAEEFGFKTGDKILSINGEVPERAKDLSNIGVFFGSEWEIERNGQKMNLSMPDTLFRRAKEGFLGPMNQKVSVLAVADGSGAAKGGLQKDDVITKVNNQQVRNFFDFKKEAEKAKNKSINITVNRGNKPLSLTCAVDSLGRLGFNPIVSSEEYYPRTDYSWGSAFAFGAKEGWDAIYYNAKGFALIFAGKISAVESIQSPIGIAKIFGGDWQWDRFWKLTGLISFVLAFMNILPIPALDGGHMVFLAVEMLRGKPLSDAFLEKAQIVGFIILLPLMMFAIGKDIWFNIILPFFQ